jgi:predicted negative regulator of RcsB-dependent stress response
MRNILLGILLALVGLALGVIGHKAYQDHQLTRASATYLFAETEIKDKQGKALSRSELIDLVLREAITKAK